MDATECSDKPVPFGDIAPNGDVILVVGQEELRLRVYSQCLSSASDVFRAMFSPQWSQGQVMSDKTPKEIHLEEDDASAMRTICNVIHHRMNDVPQAIKPSQALQIAIAADKYLLTVAFKYIVAQWIPPKGKSSMVEMGSWTATALLFGERDMFATLSLSLIMDYEGSYTELLDHKPLSGLLPLKMFCLLEERRSQMRVELYNVLVQGQKESCSNCGWFKSLKLGYAALQQKYNPAKIIKVPVSQVIKDMEAVSCNDDRQHLRHSGYWRPQCSQPGAVEKTEPLPEKLMTIKKRLRICADCVAIGAAAKPCGSQHE